MDKIEILQLGPYPVWDDEKLQARFTMRQVFEAENKDAFVAQHAASVRGIATRGEIGADRDLIEALPNLEIISVYGVGFDKVNLEAARKNNVRVTNTPDVLTKDVADLGIAMMLVQARGMVGAEDWVRSGKWANNGLYDLKYRVHGKRVGILGLGRIGYEVGKRLAGFDMDIAYTDLAPRDSAPEWTYLENPVDLARHADFLFVTLAASAETRHVVGRDVLAALGPEGMLINISRASNIDETALLDALETGSLGSAALDVFEDEPDINPRFLALENILLQPHHASGTFETRKAMGQLMYDNLAAHFDGRNLLTPVV